MRNKLIEWLGGVSKERFEESTSLAEKTMSALADTQDAARRWEDMYFSVAGRSPAVYNERLLEIGARADQIGVRHGA